MIKLDQGNVLLKPCQRRQFLSSLRRALRLGSRLGDFGVTISLRRDGRLFEMQADVHDSLGDFRCRCRQHDWRSALRDLTRSICNGLHAHAMGRVA
jgi:hypothetical protein